MLLAKLNADNLVVDLVDTTDVGAHRGYMIAPPGAAMYMRWNGTAFEETDQSIAYRSEQAVLQVIEQQKAALRAKSAERASAIEARVLDDGSTILERLVRLQVDAINAIDEKLRTDLQRQFLVDVAAADAATAEAAPVDDIPAPMPAAEEPTP